MYRSCRVQAEYEKFLAGERNRYSPLFIYGVIPKSNNFHQQFDIFIRLTNFLEMEMMNGVQNLRKLDSFKHGSKWSTPSCRSEAGCNDICWCCGEWCAKKRGDKFTTYICLIGRFRGPVPVREKQPPCADPMANSYPTAVYPFLCWTCYERYYRTSFILKLFDNIYIVDHISYVNDGMYNFALQPLKPIRVRARNQQWSRLNAVNPKLFELLDTTGLFNLNSFIGIDGNGVNFICELCGREITTEKASHIQGTPIRKYLPTKVFINGIREEKPYATGIYFRACDICVYDDEFEPRNVYFPYGIRFKVEVISKLN